MSKIKRNINNVEETITSLQNELLTLDKEGTQEEIGDKTLLAEQLKNLLENKDIQKRYPKYLKLKKLFHALPSIVVAILTASALGLSIILKDVTFTTFLPMIILATDYVAYHVTDTLAGNAIENNENYKPYYDLYGDKQYSAKKVLSDLNVTEKELAECKERMNTIGVKEDRLSKLQEILNKLFTIRDRYVEQTMGNTMNEDIEALSQEFANTTDALTPKDGEKVYGKGGLKA